MNHLKGEALNVGFDGGIKLEFHGAKVIPLCGIAERLSIDPVMRAITGKNVNSKKAASINTIGRFETDILTQRENNITAEFTCRD